MHVLCVANWIGASPVTAECDESAFGAGSAGHETRNIAVTIEPVGAVAGSAPGTAITDKPLRRYLVLYAAATAALAALMGAASAVILPIHVQQIEFAQWFSGIDAQVDLRALTELSRLVDSGITATPEQQRLLARLADFDAARAQGLSVVTAVGVVLTMLVQPLVGLLSDRTRSPWGRRAPWIAAGAVTGAACLVGMRFSASIAVLVVAWSLTQLAVNIAQGPLSTTVADRVPENRLSVASAISGAGTFLGGVLGSGAAGGLLALLNLDSYVVFAGPLVVCCVLFVLFAKDRSSMELKLEPMSWTGFTRSFLTPLRHHDYRWVWIAKALMMFGTAISTAFTLYMLQSYIQPVLSMDEATRMAPLLILAVVPGAIIAMALCGAWSAHIARRKPFVVAAALLSAAAFTVPLVWPTLSGLFVQYALSGLALGTYVVVDQALMIEVLPQRHSAGRDLGLGSVAGNLGQAIGPIVAGLLVALAGDYRHVLLAGIVVVLAAGCAVVKVQAA
ncbi:MFS transporter [soil metagenome]